MAGEGRHMEEAARRNRRIGLKPTALASGLMAELDWDVWLGPAKRRPFDLFRCIYNFRWF